jgi:hypothetical protein
MTLVLTRFSAWKRAGMVTSLLRPGTILKALYGVVQDFGVASSDARMAAMESLVAW